MDVSVPNTLILCANYFARSGANVQSQDSTPTHRRRTLSESRPGALLTSGRKTHSNDREQSFPATGVDESSQTPPVRGANGQEPTLREEQNEELFASPVESSPTQRVDRASEGASSSTSSPTFVGRDDLTTRLNGALVKSANGTFGVLS